jgi:hypothetical protein
MLAADAELSEDVAGARLPLGLAAQAGRPRGAVTHLISFRRLGTYGQLANQMFQYATVKSVAVRRGYEARIPRPEGLQLTKVFDVPEPGLTASDAESLIHYYCEPHFHFSDAVFDVPDNCDLHGYFQSEKYFAHCEAEIRSSLEFNARTEARADAASSRLLLGWRAATPVSLHVRRTDYLVKPEYHPACSTEFYERALESLEDRFGRLRVVVFSDDLKWCRKTFRGSRYHFATGNDAGTDMCVMSRCEHHVIANSSFSWWAAWLNPSPEKVVIAPSTWFGPLGPQDTQDLLPPSWEIL